MFKLERRSKPLDQRDSAGAGRLAVEPGLLDQVGGNDAVSGRCRGSIRLAFHLHSACHRRTVRKFTIKQT
jgi:hypothetical protein